MGLRSLHEELERALGDKGPGSSCRRCGSLSEALRVLSADSGLAHDALEEAMKCNPRCRDKYVNADGTFKGADACKKLFSECCKGVRNPEALCVFISRRAGRT